MRTADVVARALIREILIAGVLISALASIAGAEEAATTDTTTKFMQLALDCVHREYPNRIGHTMESDDDVAPARVLHPVFYGCFDWHSSVHGHWLLVRLSRLHPNNRLVGNAREALNGSFVSDKVAVEVAYLSGDKHFERPYGTAWLLQLTAELREWDDDDAKRWLQILAPLEEAVIEQFRAWLPKLAYPIRLGTHNQTAFGFALALDWARTAEHEEMQYLLLQKIDEFHANDVNCPLGYEPSGEDFLSPCLMEADLVRRVLDENEFQSWLHDFLPMIPEDGSQDWLTPGVVNDPTDGKLVHLDGVNLSRAWNLLGIAESLPDDDPRRGSLLAVAQLHAETGLASVSSEHYEGGHWLASFATYLASERWSIQ
jgi:hypothetical protein